MPALLRRHRGYLVDESEGAELFCGAAGAGLVAAGGAAGSAGSIDDPVVWPVGARGACAVPPEDGEAGAVCAVGVVSGAVLELFSP